MPTITNFTPSPITTPPFQFAAILDGNSYDVAVTWNVYGQRWYATITDQSGDLVLSLPVVGSPPDYPISLTAGYFNSTLVFYQQAQQFIVTP
jgi:hypothetical protein